MRADPVKPKGHHQQFMDSIEDRQDSFLSSDSDSENPQFRKSHKQTISKNRNTSKSGIVGDAVTNKGNSLTSRSSIFQSDFEDDTIFVKYHFYWFNKKENNKIYSIFIELPVHYSVKEALQKVLLYFNENLEKKTHFKLVTNPDAFEVYSAKKDGQPKLDYPAMDSSQNLNQTGIQNFCIIEKDTSGIVTSNSNYQSSEKPGRIVTKEDDRSPDLVSQSQGITQSSMVVHQDMLQLRKNELSGQQLDSSVEQKRFTDKEEEVCCFCFHKSKKSKERNGDFQDSQLLFDETTLTDPLRKREN